jgi:hypothetical protein
LLTSPVISSGVRPRRRGRHDYARALWITGLTDLLPMFDDVQAALNAHAAKAS